MVGDTIAQTRFESVSKHSNDSLLARGNTLRSDEDRLKLDELMALCTTLQQRVLDLEKTKTTQHNEIVSLKRRVKKLEKKDMSRTHRLKRLYKVGLTTRVESSGDEESLGEDASKQGRIDAIDVDEETTLVSVHDVDVFAGEEVFATTVDDITLAQALEELKTTNPKMKGVVIQELGESTTTISSQQSQDKGKGILIEKRKKAKIDVDYQLAERLQAQEQEELSIKEKATLFQQLLEKKRKHFAAKRAEEKRNKPPTKAQQRKIMCTYLNNMEGYKLKDLKTKLVKGKDKRAGIELIQENTKKQKVDDDKETTKLKQCWKLFQMKKRITVAHVLFNAAQLELVLLINFNENMLEVTTASEYQVNAAMILNGDGPIQVTTDEKGIETKVPPKTAQALLQRQRERKAKSILLLAIPNEYQLRFHGIKDVKSLWAAIKSRFGGNVESKKMQKTVLKQQFENFFVSDIEGLDKAYDRFQKLISLLEVHGAAVPNEDANQNFLRALPSSWNNVALIMRNKDSIDDLDIDDLYNNLKVFEADIKGLNSQGQASSSSYTDGLIETNSRNLSTKKSRKTGNGDLQDNALIIQDGLGYDCIYIAQKNQLSLLSCPTLQTPQGLTQSKANLEIIAYQLGLESVEAQLVVHQKNEAVYEEKIVVLEFEVKDKSNAVTRLKNQLDETLREKDDLKAKLEQFETSSKNLNKLINSQLSSKDKTGLGYGDQLNENDSSGSELFNSVFDSRSSDGDDNQTNDRFKKDNGYHVVPPPLTRNYMPPLADLSFAGLDDSVYRPTTA
ncbi:hypothetical protein Tco_0618324 [Tanacetum coccineum]